MPVGNWTGRYFTSFMGLYYAGSRDVIYLAGLVSCNTSSYYTTSRHIMLHVL